MSNILITGNSGFIGRKLVSRLKSNNIIFGYCRKKSTIKGIIEINDEIINIGKHKSQLKNIDIVFHLAALINFNKSALRQSLVTNVAGTSNLLKFSKENGIKKFIYVSAGATLGYAKDNHSLVSENSNYIPGKYNSYAYSKYLAEKEILKYSKFFDVIIVNSSTVYGDGDRNNNSSSLVKMISRGIVKVFFPGGTSYIDVDDLVSGLVLVMKNGENANRYILSKENLTYKDLVNRIAKVLQKKGVLFTLPNLTYYPLNQLCKIFEKAMPNSKLVNSAILEGFYKFRYFDTTKAKKKLGFKPKYAIEDSVRKILSE